MTTNCDKCGKAMQFVAERVKYIPTGARPQWDIRDLSYEPEVSKDLCFDCAPIYRNLIRKAITDYFKNPDQELDLVKSA
jgi:hypothetical protein